MVDSNAISTLTLDSSTLDLGAWRSTLERSMFYTRHSALDT
jgi:hypothetical protein